MAKSPISRREQILQALAGMLEQTPGGRITTAGLAREVGVSEAALYRHFPSKARMFEGLIDFIESTVFSRVSRILQEHPGALQRTEALLLLLATFAERNPGITRLLTGDALTGETGQLRRRIGQFLDRIETQLRQILREARLDENDPLHLSDETVAVVANVLLAAVEGRLAQFVRSDFQRPPTRDWQHWWRLLSASALSASA